MNVGYISHSSANKAARKDTADETHIHSKQRNNPDAGTPSASAETADSFASAPEIEYYSNYSKNGVLYDMANAEQAHQAEQPLTTAADKVEPDYKLYFPPLSNKADSLSPNWNIIPHKGMTTMSPDEIKQRVWELGAAFSKATSDEEKGRILNEAMYMFSHFVSHVSPDRKSLYEQALKTIKQHAEGRERIDITEPKNLLYYLNRRDGLGIGSSLNGMKEGKPYPMAGGGTVTAFPGGLGVGATFEVSYHGEKVLFIRAGQIRGNGVGYSFTAAEEAMNREIANHFDRAAGRTPIVWD